MVAHSKRINAIRIWKQLVWLMSKQLLFSISAIGVVGIALPRETHVDGLDSSPAFLGSPLQRGTPLLWEYGRQADYLFPREPGARSPNLAIRSGNWKLLVNADASGAELYDIATDPNETKNLANEMPEVAKQLQTVVLAWRKSLP